MKKTEVQIDGIYTVKVSGRLVDVRVTRECNYGGWYGKNLATGREIRIRRAARLRRKRQIPYMHPAVAEMLKRLEGRMDE